MPDCSMEYLEHFLDMEQVLKKAKQLLKDALPEHIIEKMAKNEREAIIAAVQSAMANIDKNDLKKIKDNKKLLEEFELEVKYLIPEFIPNCHDDKIIRAAENFSKAMSNVVKAIG